MQLIEEDGPLDDSAELRRLGAGDDRVRLVERAWLLGKRLGLQREWARWRRFGGAVLLVLALAVAALAWGLAHGLLGEERRINAVAAFASLLGLHALSWLVWAASLVLTPRSSGTGLGRLALQLTARLDRGPHALQLARATGDVLARARLAPWVFGALSHLIWSLSFAVLLLGLALGFALRAYRLDWETTILTPGFFTAFTEASAWLPARLGFPPPDAAALLAGTAGPDQQRDWAWWLIGCVAIYGLGLRLLSLAACALVWRVGRRRLAPDLGEPYARRLLARLPAAVEALDPEQPQAHTSLQSRTGAAGAPLLIGFELPPEADWPPRRIAGSLGEREALLAELAAAPPVRLLIVCHGASSPDRGTARLLREAAGSAGATALLVPGRGASRWRDWLAASGLAGIALHEDRVAALAWLEPHA
ncbi:DUF2868 domain-containing protein [Pelomonas sp. KK5]|uniref:DUF2868 domain-containing protein n=1 Tax=Pelomonas sp. KK5 TaxID=1855730 RepID=UPI001301DCF4|nr:DUF2868 domain-containing protein [Pelomonas sp. KK5]